jgi:hypothetical protein
MGEERRDSMSTKKIAVAALAVFAAAVVLSGIACKGKSAGEAVAEKRLENMMEKASGGKVDLDLRGGTVKVKTADGSSVLTTGERKWPEDLPGDAIALEPTKVRAVVRSEDVNGKQWSIHIFGFGEDVLEQYSAKLKAADWDIQSNTSMGKGGMISAVKGSLQVHLIVNVEDKTGSISFRRERE